MPSTYYQYTNLWIQSYTFWRGVKPRFQPFAQALNCHRMPAMMPSTYCQYSYIHLWHQIQVILSVGFYHGSIYTVVVMWHAKYSLSHAHPVATTEALNESCKLSRSLTQLTRRRDYLPVKPSQEIFWASFVFLSALPAKALYWKIAQGYLLRC